MVLQPKKQASYWSSEGINLTSEPELMNISKKLQLEAEPKLPIEGLYQHFMRLCSPDSGGLLNKTAFTKCLGIGSCTPFMERIYMLMDLNQSGEVDFKEYLCAAINFCVLQAEDLRFVFTLTAS